MKKNIVFTILGLILVALVGVLIMTTLNKGGDMSLESGAPAMVDQGSSAETVATEAEAKPDIIEAATASGEFTTLLSAIGAVGLTETLKSSGPFTVFAPRDAAFTALPEGTLEDLLQPENAVELATLLTYHIVPSKVLSGELTDGMEVQTAQGTTLTIGVGDSGVTVNGAAVVTADIETANGVIHVIDTVLVPPTE